MITTNKRIFFPPDLPPITSTMIHYEEHYNYGNDTEMIGIVLNLIIHMNIINNKHTKLVSNTNKRNNNKKSGTILKSRNTNIIKNINNSNINIRSNGELI
eukprot:62045_1